MIKLQTPRLTLIPLDHQLLLIWKQLGRKGLEKILEQCNSVKRWNAYFAKYTCPWTLKLIDSTEIPNTIDANSAACIQASKKDQKDSI